ncbi:hypothetical protein LCGC14_2059480 [marine sediment metagenome]|uniref:Uncharacterized protein n=1 Tax=marine sediment metagenome TaxID=412755 RepID=A0A0F9ELP4_9ZZZZ
MTTRYQSKHYEDVARIIAVEMDDHPGRPNRTPTLRAVARQFADLFAADNPKRCTFHGDHNIGYSEDCKITGFDREQFLAACGLESEG